MLLRTILAAVVLGARADALVFNGPRATPPAFANADVVAHFDAVPAAAPTAPPRLNAELVRRAGSTLYFAPDNTCGYVTGNPDLAYTCNNENAQCAISTPSANTGYIGCCDGGSCAGYHIDCIDRDAFSTSSACNSSCRANTLTLKCTASSLPYCNSVSINGGSLKVFGYFCNDAVSTMQALYTTYNGETDGRAFTASVVTVATDPASFGGGGAPVVTSSSIDGAPPSSDGLPVPSTVSTTGGGGGGKKSNTGAIVGGVVGGVVGIALIAAVVFFFMRRARKNAGQPPVSPGPGYGMSQVGTQPPAGGYYQPPPGAPPQQYYGVPGVAAAGAVPDRTGSASPLKPDYAGSGSPQPGHDYRMSSVSAVTSAGYNAGPISPQTTGPNAAASPGAPTSPQVPATIHEAAGNAVGTPDYNANHRGEMVELA